MPSTAQRISTNMYVPGVERRLVCKPMPPADRLRMAARLGSDVASPKGQQEPTRLQFRRSARRRSTNFLSRRVDSSDMKNLTHRERTGFLGSPMQFLLASP